MKCASTRRVIGALVASVFVLTACKAKLDPEKEKRHRENLGQLGIYLELYESKFKAYPQDLSLIKRPDMLSDDSLLTSPLTSLQYSYRPPAGGPPAAGYVLLHDAVQLADGTRWVYRVAAGTPAGKPEKLEEAEFQKALSVR